MHCITILFRCAFIKASFVAGANQQGGGGGGVKGGGGSNKAAINNSASLAINTLKEALAL
jgi:hypothetical protein